MLTGETTTRSALDAAQVIATLCQQGVRQLHDEPHIWLMLDGSDLRKPHARQLAHLQPVRRQGGGMVPGYATMNVLGVGRQQRGLLYHRLFSSTAPDFVSEPAEVRTAIRTVGAALAPLGSEVTALLDRGFDDQAIWGELWAQGWSLVCRVSHRERHVRAGPETELVPLATLASQLQPLAQVETETVVQKHGQPRPKLQPVQATISATPVLVPVRWRPAPDAPEQTGEQACWLVEARRDGVPGEPWWLLTDRPVETAAQATEIYRMYCHRWAIEDTFKVAKTCLGLEEVQVLSYEAIRLLVALGWVAAGFLFSLGVRLDWPEVRLLRRLGGGEDRPNRPPGKIVLMRGLRRLLDLLATEAILAEEVDQYGALPPRIAAMLARSGIPP